MYAVLALGRVSAGNVFLFVTVFADGELRLDVTFWFSAEYLPILLI